MFGNLGQLKNLAGMLGNAQEMKAKFDQVQESLAKKIVEADAGAGAVKVTMNGKFDVLRVQVDAAMLSTLTGVGSDADKQMIEDLIAAATNAAIMKAQQVIREEMAEATGGMNIPGLDKLLGGM